MTVKLAILKSGEDIVADIREMVVGEKEERRVVGYVLTRPCGVSLNSKNLSIDDEEDTYELKLFPWCPLSKNDKVPIASDWVVTILDPIDKIAEMYNKEVLKHGSESTGSNEQTDSDKSD